MGLFNGILNGQSFSPTLQLPGYSEPIAPSALAMYAQLMQNKAAAGSKKGSGSSSSGKPFIVRGTPAETKVWFALHDELQTKRESVIAEAMDDVKKYNGDFKKWEKKSPNAKKIKNELINIAYQETQLKRTLSETNRTLSYFEKTYDKLNSAELLGTTALQQVGGAYVPILSGGTSGAPLKYGEYMNLVGENDASGFQRDQAGNINYSGKNFSNLYIDKYQGAFSQNMMALLKEAEMSKGPGGTYLMSEAGQQVKDLANQEYKYLVTTTGGSNIGALKSAVKSIYDGLTPAGKADVSQQMFDDMIVGAPLIQDMYDSNKAVASIIERYHQTVAGQHVPDTKRGELSIGLTPNEVTALTRIYASGKAASVMDTFIQSDYSQALHDAAEGSSGRRVGQKEELADNIVTSPKYIMDPNGGSQMQFNTMTYVGSKGKYQQNPAYFMDASGKVMTPMVRNYDAMTRRRWNIADGAAVTNNDNKGSAAKMVSAMKFGAILSNGIALSPDDLGGWEFYEYNGFNAVLPKYKIVNGSYVNVPVGNGKFFQPESYQGISIRIPKDKAEQWFVGTKKAPGHAIIPKPYPGGGQKDFRLGTRSPKDIIKNANVIDNPGLTQDENYYYLQVWGQRPYTFEGSAGSNTATPYNFNAAHQNDGMIDYFEGLKDQIAY